MKKLIVITLVSTLTLAAILFSCSGDDAVTPAPSNLASGVFLGDTIPINDTTMVTIDLSVDEQADGTVNGGLWVSWLYTTQMAHRERVLHNLTFTRMPDGEMVHFSGTASIGKPAGEVHISGNIVSGSVIEDTVTFADGRIVAGTMNRRGPFLRPSDSKSTLDSVSDNVGTYPAIWGFCPLPMNNGQLVITSATVNDVGTIDLEGKAIVWYEPVCSAPYYAEGDTITIPLPWVDGALAEIKGGVLNFSFYFYKGTNIGNNPSMVQELVYGNWNPADKNSIYNTYGMLAYGWSSTPAWIGPKE